MTFSKFDNMMPVIVGIDGQVVVAAMELIGSAPTNAEWIWCNGEVTSTGRWAMAKGQVPYFRGDLAIGVISQLQAEVRRLRNLSRGHLATADQDS